MGADGGEGLGRLVGVLGDGGVRMDPHVPKINKLQGGGAWEEWRNGEALFGRVAV